jgi:hypothetical protein
MSRNWRSSAMNTRSPMPALAMASIGFAVAVDFVIR